MEKTTLNKLEDFIQHIRDAGIKQAYFWVSVQKVPLKPPTDEPAPQVPVPVQLTAIMNYTAATPPDKSNPEYKRHFSYAQILATKVVTGDAEFKAFNTDKEKARSAAIEEFTGRYASCKFTEGVTE